MNDFNVRSLSFENSLKKYIKNLGNVKIKVLDVGGGTGLFWKNILSEFPTIELTICDPFDPRPLQDFSHKRIQSEFQAALPKINSQDFDLVTAIDLLEHLDFSTGYALLYEMQRISKKTSIIYTPNGFVWQPPSRNNPHNAHISGWTSNQLKEFGFQRVLGHVGLKSLFGPYSLPVNRPKSRILSYILERLGAEIAQISPSKAFALSGWLDCERVDSIDQVR
jgi:ubiquinone/menaquinone biosynthesis C-methylase UbiE